LGYEEGSSSGHPSNKESIKFVKYKAIDNNKPAKTKEENQPPRRSEGKSTRTVLKEITSIEEIDLLK
jgi:hypothetical protein